MHLTRRGWLGMASAAGAAAIAAPLRAAGKTPAKIVAPGSAARNHAPAMERIRAFAAADLADKGFPGMTLALLGADGFAASVPVGYSNVDRRLPVAHEQLFQIGSISKSLVAMALFAVADRGKVDLDARVQDLLPDHPLPPEPITVTHLLEHSSGLPNTIAGPFPEVPDGRLWTGFAPGSRYSYCNLGYALLGAIIERASGLTCATAVDTLVLKPLRMTDTVPVTRAADRARYAVGYVRLRDDLPWTPGAALAPGQWVDFDNPAGSIAATSADMTRYLAYLVELARDKGAPLFSDRMAERFRTPTIDTPNYGPGARYGNGLITLAVDGRRCFRHTGGMLAFSSAFTLDQEAGVGCYASVNVGGAGGYRPREVTEYACELLRAVGEGRALPAARQPAAPDPVKDPARFAGRWLSADGPEFTIVERGGGLFLTSGGRTRPLRQGGEGAFVTDHSAFAAHRFIFEAGTPPLLRLGDRLYGRDRAPPRQPPAPRLAKLAGVYYNPAAWSPRIEVYAVGNRLLVGPITLVEHADGSWRSPILASERLWFQHLVDGRPQTLNFSGSAFQRIHDRTL